MDRLSHERLARAVLDKLLDSGELRSVASERALALRVHYLPPLIRLDLPGDDPYLPLLNPTTQQSAIAGLRDALVRVVTHEERDHWVAVATDALDVQVSLRERSKVMRATPIYEPDLDGTDPAGTGRLGEPRLRLSWTGADGSEEAWVFREGQGLATVPLGGRHPRLMLFEDEQAGDSIVAHFFADCTVAVETPDGEATRTEPARSRIPVSHDATLTLRPAWFRFWQRPVRVTAEVLGLARLGRPDVTFTSSEGEQRAWNRNREPTIELAADVHLHARGEDRIEVDNRASGPAEVLWFDGQSLRVPAGASVTVQGAHLLGVKSPAAILWAASTGGFSAPPPRVLELHGTVSRQAPRRQSGGDALFKFEQRAALVFQDALVLPRSTGTRLEVGVRTQMSTGLLAEVALDDCVGAKLRYPKGNGDGFHPWQHVQGVVPLGATSARLELVAQAQVAFAIPAFVRVLTTDPDDVWSVGGFGLRLSSEGLDLESGPDVVGDGGAEVNGVVYRGSTRVPYQPAYRVRAGEGVFRIVRETPDGADPDEG